MTGNDHRSSDQHSHDSPTDPYGQFTAPAEITEPGAVVPITVWRLDDRDGDETATDPGDGFASRLVLTYTRQGETVVDFDADQHLRDAATAASRSYVAIARPGELADLDTITAPVSLVIVRWPRQTPSRTAASVADLFSACRLMMSAETCAIAAVSSAEPGQPGTVYAEHLAELLPAARAAGLVHVLQIVAVSGAGDGDQFLYYATRAEADAARRDGQAVPDGPAYHIDLLVFTTPASTAMSSGDADRRLRHDLPDVAEGREAEAQPDANESKYAPRTPGQREARDDQSVRGPDGARPNVNARGGEQCPQQSEAGADVNAPVAWTGDAVRGLGLTTDVETAGAILGVGRTKAYELARTGQFPVKVLRIGKRYLVPVPAILRLLDLE